jgi:transposase
VTSDVVIRCFDEFSEKTKNMILPTIVLVDNSPLHTSNKFCEKSVEWCSKNLVVVPISRYSPELNIIEILWRKVKYEWLPFSAYDSFEKLEDELSILLSLIGEEYLVNFS